jgi:predicted RNA binding protein YcfA (HicA-like mRNA interferase family)
MTKLPILSAKKVIKVLRAAGFEDAPRRGKGSHSAMMKRSAEGVRLVRISDARETQT